MTERLNRSTIFVENCGDNDQTLRNLKRAQTSTTAKPSPAPRLPLPIKSQLYRNILVPVVPGSPWGKYKKTFTRELGGKVALAVKLSAKAEEFIVRSLSGEKAEKKLLNVRQCHHDNLMRTHEIFAYNDGFYLISEPICVSLRHVCRCPTYLNESQLVAIVSQVLNGICFLTSENLAHNALTIENILINLDGDVKIANLEHCANDDCCGGKNVKCLGRVMMLLMDKHVKENSELGLTNLDQWSELAVNFFVMIMTSTPKDLQQHPFMNLKWSRGELIWFVLRVLSTAKID